MSLQEFTQRFYQLTPKPKTVFILLMEGKDDTAIGQAIGAKETTVRKHIQNLCDHFGIVVEPGEGKQQRRLRLLERGRGYLGSLLQVEREITPAMLEVHLEGTSSESKPSAILEPSEEPTTLLKINLETITEPEKEIAPLRYENWDGAAQLPEILGRQAEMITLEKWLIQERCRVVSLVGLKGSGKTTLAVKIAQTVKQNFTVLRWRSLAQGSSLMQLLDDWVNEIVPHRPFSLMASLGEQISHFLKILKEHRCLLILDDFETLLQPQALAGTFQPIYQDYQLFLQRVSEEEHQSCLLIISQEKLKCLNLAEGARLPVHSLIVEGLGKEARILLKNQGMRPEKSWETLINQCGDYPLSLILVTGMVKELFAGDVAQFLAFNPNGMTEEIWQLINTQLVRLSTQEWDLLYPLALSPTPFSLSNFQGYFCGSEMALLTIIKSLCDRVILSPESGKFALSPTLQYGVLTAIARKILEEIEVFQKSPDIDQFKLLKQYSLVEKANSRKTVNSPFPQIWNHLTGKNISQINLQLQQIQRYLADLSKTQGEGSMGETIKILNQNIGYLTLKYSNSK